MHLMPLSRQIHGLFRSTATMFPVLKLFLLPVGGGIPAGVLLARAQGLAWPITTGLYLISDLVLVLALEPILVLLTMLGGKIRFLAGFSVRIKVAMARGRSKFGGTAAGPLTLVAIAFGVDPMTGRAAALAAGHGFITGWLIAITGDMLYFAVIALTTLRLNAYFRNPETTMWVVIGAMFAVPLLVRYLRAAKIGREHCADSAE